MAGRRRVDLAGARAGRPGRRRLGGRLVQLHRPAQPDAAGLQQRAGQRLRDAAARQDARPDLPRRLSRTRRRQPRRPPSRRPTRPACSPRSRATTCSGGCTRSGCSSSAADRRRAAAGRAHRRPPRSTRSAPTAAAFHALWTLHGLGAITSATSEGGRAAVQALTHPAAGVRKAAAMVLPATPERVPRRRPRCSTRRCSPIRICTRGWRPSCGSPSCPSRMPPARPSTRRRSDPSNFGDRWLSRALYIAASRHKTPFLTQYRDDPAKLAIDALPIGLRLGRARPDWRQPAAAVLAADWKADARCPGSWESRGLTAFDGVVWFTRQVDWPADRRWPGDHPLRPHRQHRRGVGQRDQRRRRGGRSDRRPQPAGLRGAGRRVHAGRQHHHRPHPEPARRRRLPRRARRARRAERRAQGGARRAVALSRRAADQRADALRPAGRAGGARRLGGRHRHRPMRCWPPRRSPPGPTSRCASAC